MWGSCLVYCRMFSSVPGLYLLDICNTRFPSFNSPQCLHTLSDIPWEAELPLIETSAQENIPNISVKLYLYVTWYMLVKLANKLYFVKIDFEKPLNCQNLVLGSWKYKSPRLIFSSFSFHFCANFPFSRIGKIKVLFERGK